MDIDISQYMQDTIYYVHAVKALLTRAHKLPN